MYRMPQRVLIMPQGGIACAAHCVVKLMKERSIQFVNSAAQLHSGNQNFHLEFCVG